jgi:hypothetical protein
MTALTAPARTLPDQNTTDARNPTKDVEGLHGNEEVHDDMVRDYEEHADHDLSKDDERRQNIEYEWQRGFR